MTVASAILIWILAAVCALPDAVFAHLDYPRLSNNATIAVCTPFPNISDGDLYKKYNVVAKSLVYYVLPLFIIGGFYVLMARKLHHSAKEMPGEQQGAQCVAQARARRHVARMVLAFVFRKWDLRFHESGILGVATLVVYELGNGRYCDQRKRLGVS